ncbi:MAG: hypothetical protein IID46_02600 [Planctomycetes bacterium]|nr:hypothetical protein [Planctomycetota bacterium]
MWERGMWNIKQMTAEPNILILGRTQAAEMQAVVASLRNHVSPGNILSVSDSETASRLVSEENWFADLVVVCQNWPDEFSEADVQQLLSLFPLARWICCFGVWCESDGRNRDIWPLAIRTPARNAEARIRRELDVLQGTHPVLPLTASRDETYEFDSAGPFPKTTALMVRVHSPDIQYRRTLEKILLAAGHHVIRQQLDDIPDVLLWDADPRSEDLAMEIQDFCDRNPDVAVLALMTFAHPELIEAIKTCGAIHVVPKLASQTTLLEELEHAAFHISRSDVLRRNATL